MASIRLPEEIESRLNNLCQLTHRSKSFYVKEALSRYLEDMEDAYIALDRIARPNRKLLTTEEILNKLEEDK